MSESNNQNVSMGPAADKAACIERLAHRLEASSDRICDLQDRLMEGTSTLSPAEYDRLLDAYRAELVRYDHIDRELQVLENPTKSQEYTESHRMYQQYKNKIKY